MPACWVLLLYFPKLFILQWPSFPRNTSQWSPLYVVFLSNSKVTLILSVSLLSNGLWRAAVKTRVLLAFLSSSRATAGNLYLFTESGKEHHIRLCLPGYLCNASGLGNQYKNTKQNSADTRQPTIHFSQLAIELFKACLRSPKKKSCINCNRWILQMKTTINLCAGTCKMFLL